MLVVTKQISKWWPTWRCLCLGWQRYLLIKYLATSQVWALATSHWRGSHIYIEEGAALFIVTCLPKRYSLDFSPHSALISTNLWCFLPVNTKLLHLKVLLSVNSHHVRYPVKCLLLIFSFWTALKMAAGGGLGSGGGNPVWSFLWFLGLIFIGYPVAGFCAGWYILILPFAVCIDGLNVGGLMLSPVLSVLSRVSATCCWRASSVPTSVPNTWWRGHPLVMPSNRMRKRVTCVTIK